LILTLEVTASKAATLGAASRKVFQAGGGTIGREGSSDWVLPHTKVSSCHALITCKDSVFYIEDRSRNGVFLNSPRNRLERGRQYPLKSGDRILIDPYEIQVSIANDSLDSPREAAIGSPGRRLSDPPANPFELDDPFDVPGRSSEQGANSHSGPRPEPANEELDPLKLLGPAPQRPPVRPPPRAQDLERQSPLAAHYRPPAVISPPPAPVPPPAQRSKVDPLIPPEDYDPLAPDEPAPALVPLGSTQAETKRPVSGSSAEAHPAFSQVSATAPLEPFAPAFDARVVEQPTDEVHRPGPVHGPGEPARAALPLKRTAPEETPPSVPDDSGRGDLDEVLAGAGLGGVAVTRELARDFGQILRVVVKGVMDVLRARQEIKDEFRMRMTHFRAADNNPLKYSANVDDALHNLLVKRNRAYLDPVQAFEDAFRDLQDHQLAMLEGMRVAFDAMLAEFDPARLQEQFDRQIKRNALIGMPAKLRYWDLFCERRQQMLKDPETTFRKLFGEEFARAYEEQLKRLKTEGGPGKG
jgi:type VI secretion system FHA domain protein